MFRGVIVSYALVFLSLPAWAHNFRLCEAFLSSEQTATKFFQQLNKLNPFVFDKPVSDLVSLYLFVKEEEWIYAAIPIDKPPRLKPLTQDLKNHLIREFSGSHRLDLNNDEEMTRFYANGLRGIYSRIGDTIRATRVKAKFTTTLSHNEQVVFESLLSGFWFPKRLQDQELSPEYARRILLDDAWSDYSWEVAREVLREWDATGLPFTRRDFQHWWSQKFEVQGRLSRSEVERLAAAIDLADYSRHPICCVSRPGCYDCPLNRRTLKNLP